MKGRDQRMKEGSKGERVGWNGREVGEGFLEEQGWGVRGAGRERRVAEKH